MKRLPWVRRGRRSEAELPLEPPLFLGDKSNGEFYWAQTPRERRMREEILRRAEDGARRVGVDRREFLASALGMAAALSVVNLASGCGGGGGGTGGFDLPPDAGLDCAVAAEALAGDEFILDLQTHHIDDEQTWRDRHPGRPWRGEGFASFLTFWPCDLPKRSECIGPATYVEQIFLNSDTTVAVLSGFPSPMCDDGRMCTNLKDNESMALWRDLINDAAGSQRLVQHCQVNPNDRWDLQAALMERIRSEYSNSGWKCYPPWGPDGKGWWLDDDAVAGPFLEKALELGEPLICAHKGFPLPGFDSVHADPRDVGPAAVRYPQVNFIVYHSAFEVGVPVGPYDPDGGGVDRLIRTVEDHGLRGKNVYAEMGSAWALVMNDAVQAQHYVGKLLKHLGEDHLLWGSECVWFGSPQPQIEAFRRLRIADELQERYGYPALTPEIKAKILGRNGARLYGIDPEAVRCALDQSKLEGIRREMDAELGPRRWAFQRPLGPRSRREFLRLQRWRRFVGRPA